MSIGLTPARIFAVTDEDFVKIKKLIEHADTYMLGYKEMHRIQSGMDPPPGQDPWNLPVDPTVQYPLSQSVLESLKPVKAHEDL